ERLLDARRKRDERFQPVAIEVAARQRLGSRRVGPDPPATASVEDTDAVAIGHVNDPRPLVRRLRVDVYGDFLVVGVEPRVGARRGEAREPGQWRGAAERLQVLVEDLRGLQARLRRE